MTCLKKKGGEMRKVYFHIFEYISTFILFMFVETILVIIVKKPDSVRDLFLYILFGIGWIYIFFEGTYYCGSEITDFVFIGRKRTRSFSQIVTIDKVSGRLKTLRILFSLDDSKKELDFGATFIKYAFQRKQLIEMIEKISIKNPNVKFLKNDSIVSKDEFIELL